MPKRKKIDKKIAPKVSKPISTSSDLKISESYISLALGALVVLVFALILFFFVKVNGRFNKFELNLKNTPAKEASEINKNKTYTVQAGEGLFEIAEKVYGNGDLWVKIADANNISNPDQIEVGMKLIIPRE